MKHNFYNLEKNTEVCLGVKHFFPRSVVPFVAENEKVVPSPLSHIIGQFHELIPLRHPHLCEYIDLIKGKHDRIYIISEHYTSNLRKKIEKNTSGEGYLGIEEDSIRNYAFAILNAIIYLHENFVQHSNITPENILFDNEGNIRLCDYGFQYMTTDGLRVSFAFGTPKYMSPESIGGKIRGSDTTFTNPKSVVWSLGIILWELITGKHPLSYMSESTPDSVFTRFFDLWNNNGPQEDISFQNFISSIPDDSDLFDTLVDTAGEEDGESKREEDEGEAQEGSEGGADEKEKKEKELKREIEKLSPQLRDLIGRCLVWNPKFRQTAEEILKHPFFLPLHRQREQQDIEQQWCAKPVLKSARLPDVSKLSDPEYLKQKKEREAEQKKEVFTLTEVYHFWKLMGGSIESEIEKQYVAKPAIQKLPFLVPLDKFTEFYVANSYKIRHQFGTTQDDEEAKVADPSTLYDDVTHPISLNGLRKRLSLPINTQQFTNLTSLKLKEQSFDYQRHRLQVFRDILRKFQANVPQAPLDLLEQSKVDIPSILRGEIWSALLGIRGADYLSEYNAIDILRTGVSDKQISLDIPRCHQYHPLLASPVGHKKFKKVLKAWVASNTVLVYWQGLDSTLAPFLALHFRDEAMALACLQKFMNKYLQSFYTKDNTLALQEQIVAYHDPQLATHLHDIDFQPDLYAIPWFLTSFTHIFPLDRVYPLWDFLLQGPAPLPVFIAVAILMQLRSLLLTLDFNNAILLFSNLPSIDIPECIKEAQKLFENTPMSASLSVFAEEGKHWWEKRLPLKQARKELSPRIATHDVINMSWPCTIFDIRSFEEFQKVRYPKSVWVNLRDKQKEISTPNSLEQYKGTHIVTIGAKDEAATFANQLVKFNFTHVSVLNGGMDALKATAEPLLEYGEQY